MDWMKRLCKGLRFKGLFPTNPLGGSQTPISANEAGAGFLRLNGISRDSIAIYRPSQGIIPAGFLRLNGISRDSILATLDLIANTYYEGSERDEERAKPLILLLRAAAGDDNLDRNIDEFLREIAFIDEVNTWGID